MNTWQGRFPQVNDAADGHVGTAPADAYAPNGYGLFNTCGNVWEWVQDFYAPAPAAGPFPLRDPPGPAEGTGLPPEKRSSLKQAFGPYGGRRNGADRSRIRDRSGGSIPRRSAQAGGDRREAESGRCGGIAGPAGGRGGAIHRGFGTSRHRFEAGPTQFTYYRWRKEFGGLKTDQVKRLGA